jgi:hypothetical protein
MNEILAPFLFLHPPSKGTLLTYQLFDAFVLRYSERFVCQDDDTFLFKSFRLFHLLLLYHDPILASHLVTQGFPPELYSPQWFLTLFARSLPIADVLRLWDLVIAWDDAAIIFFLGICLLQRRRKALLIADTDGIPELLRDLHLHNDAEVDSVVSEAIVLYKVTPRCFTRCLRLCCVSTPDLTPLPSHMRVKTHDFINDAVTEAQAVRQVLMMTPLELISYLMPLQGVGDDALQIMQRFVVLDLRSSTDIETSCIGRIARAIQIDPEDISSADTLELVLQKLEGIRGSNIVIVDLPPVQASSGALWRRILLGEGDGVSPSSTVYGLGKSAASNFVSLFSPLLNRKFTAPTRENDYSEIEKSSILDDSTRPGVSFAKILQVIHILDMK